MGGTFDVLWRLTKDEPRTAYTVRSRDTANPSISEGIVEYMVSRPFVLPDSKSAMASRAWYILWQRPIGLFRELTVGDELYWYETPSQRIVWHTRVYRLYM
jgi:hypothetical protein